MTQASRADDAALVIAARAGDGDAVNELARRHLPVVHHLARQALPGDPDVDDVVQDIMIRAFGRLRKLRTPDAFRPWLAAIALHQIAGHRARAKQDEGRTIPLDEATGEPGPASEVEGPALLRAELAAQRRQIGHATRWMGARERAVYSLWWLETAGELSRGETARALGESVATTGVRMQRMREQLELSRKVVAALETAPGCRRLEAVVVDWDGTPSQFWRKRIGRHVRSCPVCARATGDLVPVERLLAGLALAPVPAGLAAAVLVKGFAAGAGKGAAWTTAAAQAIGAHPVVAALGAVVIAAGVAVPTTGLTTATPERRTVSPQPSRPAVLLAAGRLSLESAGSGGKYVTVAGVRGVLARPVDAAGRRQATLQAVAGLADPACFSFRDQGGRYLRHSSFRLRAAAEEGTVLFRRDATFCARTGFAAGAIALESVNYPGFYLRHVGDELWLDQSDGSAGFREQSSLLVRPPLA